MAKLSDILQQFKTEISQLIQEKEYSKILNKIDNLHKQLRIENDLKQLNEDLDRRITEKTRELSDSEEKFKTIFQSSRDALMLLTTKGFFDCNQATIDIFGFSNKEEFLNLHPSDISPVYQPNGENSIDLANKYINDAQNRKIPIFEWVHKKKSGVFFYCEVLLSPITLGGKNIVHAVVRDISERKKAESIIKKSEEKFRKLAELSPSGISIQRKNKYFYVNLAWAEITGYNIDEMDNVSPFDIIHPDMKDFVWELSDNKLKKKGATLRYNLKIITKQKKIKWLDISISTIVFENEFASIAVYNDITEVREIQDALKSSEEKYRSLIENLKYEYFFYRHKLDGVFEYISPSINNVLGYSQKEFMTHFSKYLTDNPINKEVNKKTELSIKGIQQLPYELEIYDSNNNTHILEVSETPLTDIEGNVIAVEGIAHDITKQKEAEETINQQLEEITVQNEEIRSTNEEIHAVNDDLERRIEEINRLNENLKISENELRVSNTQKDKFFSLLAHDLRSPIGNFLQISELLKLNYEELSKDQIHDFFDNLYSLADRTFKLLENLLMWSRSQLGKLEIETSAIELYKVVEGVAYLCEANLKSKSIQFNNELPHDLIVMADLNIIQTLFRNLISNAIKFSYPGGNITISSKKEIDKLNKSEYYIISVKDTGVGIPEDKLEKIFEMDKNYTTLGTENEKGTGLGLFLCKELIEKNGEKIWVGSKESNLPDTRLPDGQGRQGGSTFYFTLRR